MSVFFPIGIVFIEILSAVVTVMAFLLLARQYVERRQPRMLAFAGAFLVQAAALLAFFFGHVISAYGNDATASRAFKISLLFISVEGFLLLLAASRGFAARAARVSVVVASLILFSAAVVTSATRVLPVAQSSGVSFPLVGPTLLSLAIGPVILALLLIAVPHSRRANAERRTGRQPAIIDRVFINAALAGFFCSIITAIAAVTSAYAFILLSFLAFAASLALLFLGAFADEHPDTVIRKNPLAFVTQSLIFKAVFLHSLILLAGAFILLAFISSYFVQHSIAGKYDDMRRDLQFFSRSYSGFGLSLIDETSHLAESRQLTQGLAGNDLSSLDELKTFLQKPGGSRILRVVNERGEIVYSSFSADEIGHVLVSKSVDVALKGTKAASIEKDDAVGIWVIRAAVPIHGASGNVLGVVLDSDVDSAFDFSDYVTVSPTSASGYGYVAQNNEQVFSYGLPLDMTALKDLSGRVSAHSPMLYETDVARSMVRPVFATDGTPDGFFYVYFTNKSLEAEIFRVIALASCLTVFTALLIAGLLLLVMSVILRPVRQLRDAVERLAHEDYGSLVTYESPDEVGLLAASFNRMRDAVGERARTLKTALREQQEFLDHTTHELRTPLNIFRWTLELMRYGDTGRMTKGQLEMVEQLNQTNERLTKTVRNLEDAILIDRGSVTLRLANVAIEDVIDDVAGELAVSCRTKGIALHWNKPVQPLVPVAADGTYLRKVLLNLVSNAVKYTPKGGRVEINAVAVEHSLGGKKGPFIKVAVKDNGIGIPSHESHRVFSRFFRAQNVAEFETEGAGLGLYLAKRLVELHGGDIRLESREGEGTIVTFTIPVATDDSAKKKLSN